MTTLLKNNRTHICRLFAFIVIVCASTSIHAQYPTVLSPFESEYSSRPLTSPEVGIVEGVRNFGERLATDPDPGVGFTYRVFPNVEKNRVMDGESFVWALAHLEEVKQLKRDFVVRHNLLVEREKDLAAGMHTERKEMTIQLLQLRIEERQRFLKMSLGENRGSDYFARYATAQNATARQSAMLGADPGHGQSWTNGGYLRASDVDRFSAQSAGAADETTSKPAASKFTPLMYHQPLIQIKVRIIQANRSNSTDFRSVLDYISNTGGTNAATRLPTDSKVLSEGDAGTFAAISEGSGALVNLTGKHINFLTNMLATDFNSDILTVAEVVTLNGQQVQFVAGDKRPFPIGLTLTQGEGQSNQTFTYKHVGTLLEITPQIVNWGKHLEGAGTASIVAQEIYNWNCLAKWMSDGSKIVIAEKLHPLMVRFGSSDLPIPYETKSEMLAELEQYPADVLRKRFEDFDNICRKAAKEAGLKDSPSSILRTPTGLACDWKPADCTINLKIVAKESNINGNSVTENLNSIANFVQVKSGRGVVMGGMIGTSEIKTVKKVPVLGDIPGVAYLFRSKSTDRAKSEMVIFVEAKVLPNSSMARAETVRDFDLGSRYVMGTLGDNPLEIGMHRAGFGTYLPPTTGDEEEYWIEHGNKMRRIATEIDDYLN